MSSYDPISEPKVSCTPQHKPVAEADHRLYDEFITLRQILAANNRVLVSIVENIDGTVSIEPEFADVNCHRDALEELKQLATRSSMLIEKIYNFL